MLLSNIPQYIECKKIYNYGKKNKQFFHLSTNSKTIKKNSVLVVSNKNFKTENEINLVKQIKMKNYKEIAKKYYNEFSSIYSNLDNEFSENNYVRFINLKDIFQNEKGNVYTSWAHYNDYGCKLIAQEIYNKLSNEIDLILKRKNNSF